MTTRLGETSASPPPKKPPILTPKPKPGVAHKPVENGDFRSKLERFKHLSKVPGEGECVQRDGYQTQTIKRKPKTKSRENKNYERLNVSPVRRRSSQPARESINNNTPKKRSESDSDNRDPTSSSEIGSKRQQQIRDAIESITQELDNQKQSKQNSLRKKPVPPPKKIVSGARSADSSTVLLPGKDLDHTRSNNVQSTPGHSVVKVRTAGETQTEQRRFDTSVRASVAVSEFDRTGRIPSPPTEDGVIRREKKPLKPSHLKPQRKTAIPPPKTVHQSPERRGKESVPGVIRDSILGERNGESSETSISKVEETQPQQPIALVNDVEGPVKSNLQEGKAPVLSASRSTDIDGELTESKSQPPNDNVGEMGPDSTTVVRRNSANKLTTKEHRKAIALQLGHCAEVENEDQTDFGAESVAGVSGDSEVVHPVENGSTTSSSQRTDNQEPKKGARSIPDAPQPVATEEEEVATANSKRMSVLDMVGNFETIKSNTNTLSGMTRKKKLTGLSPRPVAATPRASPGPGLSRRLSRSLGNIDEISRSDDWGKMIHTKGKLKPKSRTPDSGSNTRTFLDRPFVPNLDFIIPEQKVAEREPPAVPAEKVPEKPVRKFVQENYDTPKPDVSLAVDGQRKRALRPPSVVPKPRESFEQLTDISQRVLHPLPPNSSQLNSGIPQHSSQGPNKLPPQSSSPAAAPHIQEGHSLSVDVSNSNQSALQPPPNGQYQTPPNHPTTAPLTHPPPSVSHPSAPHRPPTQIPGPYQSPPHPVLAMEDPSPRVILRDKTRRTLPRNHRINRKGSIDRPVYAPPLPPQSGDQSDLPKSGYPHNRNSVVEFPQSGHTRSHSRPKSECSFATGTIYATPGIEVDRRSMHPYHVLDGRHSLLIDSDPIFSQRITSSTVEDEGGYTIPGSHMWADYNTPAGLSDIPAPPPPERPRASSISDSRPRSNNNAVPAGVHGYSEPTYPEGPLTTKERNFKPLNKGRIFPSNTLKMRRKIHEAFKSKARTEEDTASVTSEDSDVDEAVTEQRLSAVRRTKARTSHYCSLEQARKNSQFDKLYEYVVVVSLKYDKERRRYEPCEIKRFPEEVSDTQNDKLRAIPHFCFPDSFKWAPVESYNSENFSFVLTSFDGSRFYGYNRRLLPPGEGARLPEVFCVMSPVACYPLYYQFLDEIEKRRKVSMEEVEVLLQAAYEKPLPKPGSRVRISANLMPQMSFREPMYLQRPQDSRLEQIDFDYLFKCLSIPHVLQIFASLLLERRIVMFSSYLSKLSKCSQAIAALLYPFAWQHVYVPVLPMKLLDMCCSPTPYIMGMLSLSIPELEDMPLEEVLIVNLDAGEFDVHVGDEVTILPRRLYQGLEKALKTCLKENDAIDTRQIEDEISEDCETRNKSISEAFILYFVELMGHYLTHFQATVSGGFVFDRVGFLKGTTSKSCKRFLEVFTETQMFSLFIQEKETDSEDGLPQTLFDQRVQSYESERRNSKLLGVVNVKKLGQKISSTAKGVKGRVFEDKI